MKKHPHYLQRIMILLISLIGMVHYATASDVYTIVTSSSTLTDGDQVIITSRKKDTNTVYAMSTTQNTNNRGQVAVASVDGAITLSSSDTQVQVITLVATGSKWKLQVGGNQYLYAAGGNSANQLKTKTGSVDDSGKATITVTDGNAVVTFGTTKINGSLRYNASSSLFACYDAESTCEGIAIYKKTDFTPPF